MARKFTFDLYRLNIEDVYDLFLDEDLLKIRTNKEIVEALIESTNSEHDQIQKTHSAIFKWSVRGYLDFSELVEGRYIHHIVFARSVVERDGSIVTDEGITSGTSSFSPPLASALVCIFDLSRHLVAIEHTGLMATTAWKEFFEKIFLSACQKLNRKSALTFEAVPDANGIIGLFDSFEKLTRLRLTLVIPNPELDRYTQSLYDELKDADIRELTQDMRNPNGLAKKRGARPYGSAKIAEQGYKKGNVHMEGFINGEFVSADSGANATKGSVQGLRDFIRGIGSSARTKETKVALEAIMDEIDKISPTSAGEG